MLLTVLSANSPWTEVPAGLALEHVTPSALGVTETVRTDAA
jgi:hypothetical protein